MGKRVEWLKLQMHHGRPEKLPLVRLAFLSFEAYYQLCTLRGYKPRHKFLEASPESLQAIPKEERILMVWPRLPLSIRLLERIWPFAYGTHAEFVRYTPEAAEEARHSSRRIEVHEFVRGELHFAGSFK